MALKDLPTEDLPFTEIIDHNYLYADKTRYIYQLLLRQKGQFFLSRPRRFGKSLLLDTLRELFTGNRQRFEGLWIGQSDYDFKAYPTLFLTLSTIDSDSPSVLKDEILTKLQDATPKGLKVLGKTPATYFGNLIKALHAEFKSKVAVLIDESDAPVTDNLANFKVAEANRIVLRRFFA
ncbi:MAG: AAA family ATPase, partial [Deltaproteobacteria bacterium]|nr:AAA family ATPase [Deltaproteobacteria bacterium]